MKITSLPETVYQKITQRFNVEIDDIIYTVYHESDDKGAETFIYNNAESIRDEILDENVHQRVDYIISEILPQLGYVDEFLGKLDEQEYQEYKKEYEY
jgi:hypothetical protein